MFRLVVLHLCRSLEKFIKKIAQSQSFIIISKVTWLFNNDNIISYFK